MKYILLFLSILLAYVPFIKPYGALDSVYPELFYISISQFFVIIYFLLFKKSQNLQKQTTYSNLIFFLFLIWSFITIIPSYNPTEGIIDWYKTLIFIISIINLTLIYRTIKNKQVFYLTILFSLSIESVYIFSKFIELYDFYAPPLRAYSFIGFTSNLNVSAYSILIKIPIVLYVFLKNKNRIVRLWSLILMQISIFNIFIISSRSSILALSLILLLLVSYAIFLKLKGNIQENFFYKRLIVFFLFSFLTISFHSLLYTNSDEIRLDKRMTSFDTNDSRSSYNFRIGFYKEAIQGFKDNPFFGVGIGNWKIFSIKYGSNRIREYQVPYNAHNDFLQAFAETGFIGGFLYFLILFGPLYILLKKIILGVKSGNEQHEEFILLLAFLIFICDSMFNFPRTRAINMVNLIFIYSYFNYRHDVIIKSQNLINKFLVSRVSLVMITLLSFSSIFVFYKLYINSKQQVLLIQDFNILRSFKRDLNVIGEISHIMPTLTHTGLPLAEAKANYYSAQGKSAEAKKLYKIGNKKNEFLGSSDVGLANLFLNEGDLDSAYFYSKRSLLKLPFNSFHLTTYQTIISKLNDKNIFQEADSIFRGVKNENLQAIWENHILILSTRKKSGTFTKDDKDLINEALVLFPNNKKMLTAEKLINNKIEIIELANEYDADAFNLFFAEKYLDAIGNWKKAKILIPNEDSYYLNIAQSYNGLKAYDLALLELDKIDNLNINENTGKLEFLRAVAYLGLEQKDKYCKNFKISYEKGYKLSGETLKKLNCN